MQIPVKLKNLRADYASWKTKEEEWKRGCVEELQAQLNDIGLRLYVAEGEKEKHLAEREKLLKACRKVYNDSRTELRKELEEFSAGVRQEIERMKQQTEERKKELKQAQEKELNGKGADTVTSRTSDDRLAEINKELDYIGKSRSQVLYYEKDKEILGSIGSGGPFGSKLCRMRKQCISKCRKQQRFRSIIFRRRQLRIGFR